MKLTDKHFELFNRESYLFAKIKEELSEEEIFKVKESYKEAWVFWKAIMGKVQKLLSQRFSESDTESWTNGWSIRNRFWTRFKYKDREHSSSSISATIMKDSLRVNLEWHSHNSEKSSNSINEHNSWIEHVEAWITSQNINPSEYRVWTSLESDSEKYITLETYLRDQEVRERYKEILSGSEGEWIRVGKVFSKEEVVNWDEVEEEIARAINDLQWIYAKTETSLSLSSTFSVVFDSMEEAQWSLDFVKQTLENLGVKDSGDPRVSITLPNKKLHINFGNWLILGFFKNSVGSSYLRLALTEKDVEDAYDSEGFKVREGEESIALVRVPREDYINNSQLKEIYYKTLTIIKERFKGYSKSPYRKSNKDQLEQAVFTPEKRLEVLTKDIHIQTPSMKEGIRYFWLTAKPSIWSVETIKEGGVVSYTAYNEKGNKRRIFSAFENAQPGDKILFYESTPRKEIVAQGEVVEGLHLVEKEGFDEKTQGVSFRFVDDITPISWEAISQVEELQDCAPIKNAAQGSLFEITEEQFDTILSLEPTQILRKEVEIPNISFEKELTLNNLYFEEKELLLKQVKTALQNGKHIILTGPPGTGKSKLAKEVCHTFEAEYEMSTANSDWSTYETIGGYRPNSDGTLSFNPGLFLQCFKDEITNKPLNKWLIIDEMNRADIDKAFGALFSALTGDPITLNYQKENGHPLLLRPQEEELTVVPNDHEYVIPNTWRLIGTINTLDKASLYEMSYAFMRRFAFIPVGVPRHIDESLVEKFLNTWNINNYEYTEALAFTWQQINNYRQIGPAIIEDIARYITTDGDLTSAIILYVLPQFEGLMDKDILEFIEGISHLKEVEGDKLKQFAEDFFHIKG